MRNFQEHLFKRTSASGFFYFCTCFQIYFRYSSFLCSSFLFVAAGELVILAFWLIIKYFKDLPRGIVRGLSYVLRNMKFSTIRSSRSSLPGVFLGKDVLKICCKFTREHPCRGVISTHFGMVVLL